MCPQTVYSEMLLFQLIHVWRRLVWVIIDFYRGIKNKKLRQRFLKFIKHDDEKQKIFQEMGNATRQSTSRVIPAASSTILNSKLLYCLYFMASTYYF